MSGSGVRELIYYVWENLGREIRWRRTETDVEGAKKSDEENTVMDKILNIWQLVQ